MADQDPVLEGIVQKLIAEDASDDDIRAVIQEHKGQVASKQMNLSRVLGRDTPQNFKLPSQQYNTPKLEGQPRTKRPEELGAEADPEMAALRNDKNLGKRAVQHFKDIPEYADDVGAFFGPVGGATGALIRDVNRADTGHPDVPKTAGEAAWNVAKGAAIPAVMNKAFEYAPAVAQGAGNWLMKKSDPLIQAAVKPAIAELKAMAGQTGTSMSEQAKRISGIIRRTGIRTPEAAEARIKALEKQVQDALGSIGPNADTVTKITDAPQRGLRYLQKLATSAGKQMSPADDLGTVATEVSKYKGTSPMFQTVEQEVTKQVPSAVLDEFGQPIMKDVVEKIPSRVPRANVTAKEALDTARGTSKHATRKTYGEMQGMSTEAQKALDRAGRDAAKAAAAGTPLQATLKEQGEMIRLKPILDRFQLRTMNRDAASLPGLVAGAPELAKRKLPIFGMLAQTMRNQQLPLGVGVHKAGQKVAGFGPTLAKSPDALRAMALLNQILASSQDERE